MAFIVRNPEVSDVMTRHDETSGTVDSGAVLYLSGDRKVAKVTASGNVPYGFLGETSVRAQAPGTPAGFNYPGQMGSTDALLGEPVVVYHGGGTADTTVYVLPAGVSAGAPLYALVGNATNNGKLTAVSASGANGFSGTPLVVAEAISSLSTAQAAAGKKLTIKLMI